MNKSKSIKKKPGNFSKSPKILPSLPPSANDLQPFHMLSGSSKEAVKDSKKGKHQATLIRMRKDSLLSEKDRRKVDILKGATLTTLTQQAKLFEVVKCQ
jgi:hypothetical protein